MVKWDVLEEAVILKWKDKIDDISIELSQDEGHLLNHKVRVLPDL